MKSKLLSAALLLVACAAAGCGDDGHDHEHGDPVDGGDHVAEHPSVPCPETIPDFVATPSGGLEVTGERTGLISAKLIDADFSPPRKFRNDWTLLFRDADGQPLDDIEIEMARSFMPVHGHDGKFPPTVSELEEPGVLFFDDINMHMGGPWEVQINAKSAKAGGSDYLVFHVCIND